MVDKHLGQSRQQERQTYSQSTFYNLTLHYFNFDKVIKIYTFILIISFFTLSDPHYCHIQTFPKESIQTTISCNKYIN